MAEVYDPYVQRKQAEEIQQRFAKLRRQAAEYEEQVRAQFVKKKGKIIKRARVYPRSILARELVPHQVKSVLNAIDRVGCKKDQDYRKVMMRKLAAQIRSSAGAGGLAKWRNRLRHRSSSKVRC